MVPGDKVETTRELAVTLEGDNLVASLTVDAPGLTAGGAANVAVTYKVYGLVGGTKQLLTTTPVRHRDRHDALARRTAKRPGRGPPGEHRSHRARRRDRLNPNVWVVVTADFPASVTGRTDAKLTTAFANLAVTLQQTRTGVDFNA